MPTGAYYQGLNAAPDYNTRRRDVMQNITIATRMRDDAIRDMQERMKAMGVVADDLNKQAEMQAELLPADADRFQAAHEKLLDPVIGELGKYNNDPRMLQMMAPQIMSKYKRDLLTSPELRDAKENLKNYGLGTAAIQKGEWVAPVEVEYDGGTKEKVDWIEAVKLHQDGIIKKLPFSRARPMPEINPLKLLSIEMPSADSKHKGYVGKEFLADMIQAENPDYPREDVMSMVEQFNNPEVPGATKLLWGRVIPRNTGGSGYSSYLAQQKYLDKLSSVKSITDNLHRAMYDPANKTTYDPQLKAYNLNVNPVDLSKLRKGTGTNATEATNLLVRNDPSNPGNSRFIVKYDDGVTNEELSFDDLAQRILGASNVNISDYTRLMQYVNGGMNSNYDPLNYAAFTPELAFNGVVEDDSGAMDYSGPKSVFVPKIQGNTPGKGGGKKVISYGRPAAAAPAGDLINLPGWSTEEE